MKSLGLGLLWALLLVSGVAQAAPQVEVDWPARRLWVGAKGIQGIKLRAVDAQGTTRTKFQGSVTIEGLLIKKKPVTGIFQKGVLALPKVDISAAEIQIQGETISARAEVPTLGGAWTLLPAFLAIGLALVTRQVLLSLFGGIWLGAALIHQSALAAFPRSLDMIVSVTADADKIKIISFTLLMGGVVGLISVNGGTTGIVAAIAKRATTPRSGAIATWAMGLLVFFDDYASSLLIGTTMRPITDRLKISREKLSYLVDSTAAPISSLAIISTWIGYEVSVLADAMKAAGIQRDAYEVFISGLSSRFYQIYALLLVLIVAVMRRDFGPMLTAERRARHLGKLIRDGGEPLMDAGLVEEADRMNAAPPRWWLAAVPLVALVGCVLLVLLFTGLGAASSDPTGYAEAQAGGFTRQMGYILSNAASYDALVYGSGLGVALAIVLSVASRALGLKESLDAFVRGVRAMILAVIVLCLAWSIGKVMADLHAGTFVATLIGDQLPPWSLSTITFVLAAVMAFATGTSWGTMAILFPIVIPVAALHAQAPGFEPILLGTSSAILAGAVFGDHCSPISDTTILSSIASAADHVDHTKTQAPYASLAGAVSLILGYIPFGLGAPAWVCLILGIASLIVFMRFVGKIPEDLGPPD